LRSTGVEGNRTCVVGSGNNKITVGKTQAVVKTDIQYITVERKIGKIPVAKNMNIIKQYIFIFERWNMCFQRKLILLNIEITFDA
jgi:hypothetical protein